MSDASQPRFCEGHDPWLDRWRPLITSSGTRALEIGCGPGFDVSVLADWGLTVVATDVSPEALAASQLRNPQVRHLRCDARNLDALAPEVFDVVIASLSLHYFDRAGTLLAFAGIARRLRAGGVLLFRVNAHDDFGFGAPADASGWNTVAVGGGTKQFFTAEKIREGLAGQFTLIALEQGSTTRYGRPKSFFECVARQTAANLPS